MKESVETLNNNALHLAEKGSYDEAIECLKRALTLDPLNHLIWFNLGVTFRDCGMMKEAADSFAKAHDIDEDEESYTDALAITRMNMGNIDEAMQLCAEALTRNEMNARIWNTFGVLYFNKNKMDLAAEAFEKAVMINPYYYDALYNLRDTYEEMGNKDGMNLCIKQMKLIKQNKGASNA